MDGPSVSHEGIIHVIRGPSAIVSDDGPGIRPAGLVMLTCPWIDVNYCEKMRKSRRHPSRLAAGLVCGGEEKEKINRKRITPPSSARIVNPSRLPALYARVQGTFSNFSSRPVANTSWSRSQFPYVPESNLSSACQIDPWWGVHF